MERGEEMKKSLSLVFVALLFVVMGCSLDRFTGKSDSAPTPAEDTSSDSKSDDKSSDDKSSDDKSDSSAAGLTMANYEKIKPDMSYEEVEKILGSEGEETRTSSSGNREYKSYKWKGDNYVSIYVNFTDNKMASKSQAGLKGSSSAKTADITKAMYEKIENGMDLKEVEEIIGSKGEETSSSKIGKYESSAYRWKGEKYSFITVRLRDGKVQSKSQYGLK
jgi:hypothetical protein